MLDWIGCCVIVTGVVVWVYGDDCSYLGRGLWLIRGWRIVLYELMGLMWVDWSGVWGLSNRLDLVWVFTGLLVGWVMWLVVGVGFCWLRDVLWDGCLGSLCNCLVGCCDWFLTVGFVVGWSGFGFWFRVGLWDSGMVVGCSVLVCGVVVVGYDLVWISVGGLADGWLLL